MLAPPGPESRDFETARAGGPLTGARRSDLVGSNRAALSTSGPTEFLMPILDRIAAMQPEIAAWRRDIHAHPEILFDVHRTAASVAEKLKAFGCDEVVTGIGKTGVVGVIRGKGAGGAAASGAAAGSGGAAGRVIGLRAEHGCAADGGADEPSLPFDQPRQDACVRP